MKKISILFLATFPLLYNPVFSSDLVDCNKLNTKIAKLACIKQNSKLRQSEMELEKRKQEAKIRALQEKKMVNRGQAKSSSARTGNGAESNNRRAHASRKHTRGGKLSEQKAQRTEQKRQRRALLREQANLTRTQSETLSRQKSQKSSLVQADGVGEISEQDMASFSAKPPRNSQANTSSYKVKGLLASSDGGDEEDDGWFTYY